jgi:hypothetical protein
MMFSPGLVEQMAWSKIEDLRREADEARRGRRQ